ncbi:MAG: prepilin-type N-terminal cleavage/methylation domain-containing protein [Gammaproteobacteria bacterium]|nr:MAG: prepilin-type N-terminal cleavage/methylation domain-containing protein [Gammaproteobacteria bacterium]
MSTRPSNTAGFTLIELAIVLFIIALLLGGLLGPLAVQVEKRERDETRDTMDLALEAVYGHVLANGYLPCPDTDGDGTENRQAAATEPCSAASGTLPWKDLGVTGMDAWGRNIIYRVTQSFANKDNGEDFTCGNGGTTGVSFRLCSEGDIEILDKVGGDTIADKVPAVIVSVGKERPTSAEASTDEKENLDSDEKFVRRDYTNNFDDMVSWISPNVLRNRMVTAGRLP